MGDLITADQFKTYAQVEHTDDDALIALLITGVSADIVALTGRDFSQSTYIELLNGGGLSLAVKKPPVCAVMSIVDVMALADSLLNGCFAGNADYWTLGAGWALYQNRMKHTAGDVEALSQSVGFDAGQTWRVQYQISGMSAGTLTASVAGNDGTARSTNGVYDELIVVDTDGSDLLSFTPSTEFDGVVDRVKLSLVDDELVAGDAFEFDSNAGLVRRVLRADDDFWYSDSPVNAGEALRWPAGYRRWRVEYVGGYESVPDVVQLICLKMVAVLYEQGNPAIQLEMEGDSSKKYGAGLAADIRRMIERFSEVSF